MRREAETFCREFSRENSLVLPAVLESTGQERCGLQRVRESRPGAHTAAMHTDACKQYCGRPSLRVRLQIFRRLPFLASASRKLRLCRAQCASRSASDKQGARNARVTTAQASPEIEPTSAARHVSLCRSNSVVANATAKTAGVACDQDAGRNWCRRRRARQRCELNSRREREIFGQLFTTSWANTRNCVAALARPRQLASTNTATPATRPVFVSFHRRSKIIQASRKNIEKAPSDHYVTHIQCIRLQLRFSTIGPLYSWEHELISLSAGSYPDHRRGARRDPLSGTQPQHCTSRRCELPGKYCRVLNERRPRPKARWIAGLSRRHTLRCCTQMRREAETFCREFSRENSLVLPAVLESTGQERCGLQRVREFRPGAHTAAMHTDACKQYCGRPSLRVRLQIFRRLPFLASASRKLRLCRAQVRRAVRLINKAPATPVLLPPKLAQKSNPLRLLRKQVWADLIRSSQIPPPRQPVRRVIKTLAIIGADAAERGSGASQILKDSARYSENCLQRAGRPCGTASSPWPDPDSSPLQTRRCPPHALFSQVSADQKQNKLRENIQKCCVGQLCNSHPVRPITAANQRIWPTLQLGTRIGFTFSWKLSRPQARGAA
ncbi:Hypothetical_protein [Hexamita inflata]|uniref:Hypothetical_protein n=1 Tax=Hexamita inflata TaxID=28002 RepID=A0AA86TR80_9EUKA|nr:Hypothetical protein HINF_LOCUS11357 [Hexamita inflata]